MTSSTPRLVAASIGIVAALAAPGAFAEFYVGAAGGKAQWDECFTQSGCDKEDTAWSARAGYRFSPYFGIEGRYVDLGTIESHVGIANDEIVRLAMSARGVGINATATLPIGDRFGLSAIAGVARMELQSEFRGTGSLGANDLLFNGKRDSNEPYYGVRAQWSVTPQLEVSLEAERYELSYAELERDATFIGLGAVYRFR